MSIKSKLAVAAVLSSFVFGSAFAATTAPAAATPATPAVTASAPAAATPVKAQKKEHKRIVKKTHATKEAKAKTPAPAPEASKPAAK